MKQKIALEKGFFSSCSSTIIIWPLVPSSLSSSQAQIAVMYGQLVLESTTILRRILQPTYSFYQNCKMRLFDQFLNSVPDLFLQLLKYAKAQTM